MFDRVAATLRNVRYMQALTEVGRRDAILQDRVFVVNASRCDANAVVDDFFLAIVLHSAGARVHFIYDDGSMPFDVSRSFHGRSRVVRGLRRLVYASLFRATRKPGLVAVPHGRLRRQATLTAADVNKVMVRKHVETTLSRYYEGFEWQLDRTTRKFLLVQERIKQDALASIGIAKACREVIQPDAFLTSHGIYSSWGPAFEYMRSVGVPSVVFCRNIYSGHLMLLDLPDEFCASDRRFRCSEPERADSLELAETYLRRRLRMQASDNKLYFNVEHLEQLDLPGDKEVYVMCPNVVWDGNVQERNHAFPSMVEWVFQTIDLFIAHPEARLVVRCHPAEATLYLDSLKLEHLIALRYSGLTPAPNVLIVSSSRNVDTYDLIRRATATLVYDGMPAVESAYIGTPALICGRGRLFGNGVGIDIDSIPEYEGILWNPDRVRATYDVHRHKRGAVLFVHNYCIQGNYATPHTDVTEDHTFNRAIGAWFRGPQRAALLTEIRDRTRGSGDAV